VVGGSPRGQISPSALNGRFRISFTRSPNDSPVAQIFLLALFINKRFNKQRRVIASAENSVNRDQETPIVEHSTRGRLGGALFLERPPQEAGTTRRRRLG
jgi:hypothetical protein